MGNCLTGNSKESVDCNPAVEDDNFCDGVKNELDVDYFKVAIQNCVSVSVGVPSRNVIVNNVTKSSWVNGVDVTYSVTDVFDTLQPDAVSKHIDNSVASGKFTSLLHQHGFLSASSKELTNSSDLMNGYQDDQSRKTIIVHVIQTITGIELPEPKPVEEGSAEGAAPASLRHLLKKARSSILQKSNSLLPIGFHSAPTAVPAELDYSTPAFKAALQQSVAVAARVPNDAVKIIEISPSSSGADLDVVYSVVGDSQQTSISDFKHRIDEAVAGGHFTSSLQDDGYFSVSAEVPTTLIHSAFTLKQTISIKSVLPRLKQQESIGTIETREKIKSLLNMGSPLLRRLSGHEMKEVDKSVKNLGILHEGDELPGVAGYGTVSPEAVQRARASSRRRDDDVRAKAVLNKMSDELLQARRDSKNGKLLRIPSSREEPVGSRSNLLVSDEIPEPKGAEKTGQPIACPCPSSSHKEVTAEDMIVTPLSTRPNTASSRMETPRSASGREIDIRVEEEKRLVALKDEVARLEMEDEKHTQMEADERLLKIEDLHRLREIKRQFAASAAKLKVEEVFRHKKEKGRAIALAAKLRRDSDWDSRKIRLEDSKHAFEEVKLKSVLLSPGLCRSPVDVDGADVAHRRNSAQEVSYRKPVTVEHRRSSVGDNWRNSLALKNALLRADSSDGEDAFDLVPKEENIMIKSAFDTYIAEEEGYNNALQEKSSAESAWGASNMWQSLSALGTG